MALQTEFEFALPRGYVDPEGNLHRTGIMRLATAGDEILPLKEHKVQSNPAYLTIILLSRVITRLGSLEMVTTKVIEDLFASDLAYLQDFYRRINDDGTGTIEVTCPKCENRFELEVNRGE